MKVSECADADGEDDRRSVSTTSSTGSGVGNTKRRKPTYYYVSSSEEEFDTLKDKFWRNLEEGKVNVFGSDMYSKVKTGEGRAGKSDSSSIGSVSPTYTKRDDAPVSNEEQRLAYTQSLSKCLSGGGEVRAGVKSGGKKLSENQTLTKSSNIQSGHTQVGQWLGNIVGVY